MIVRSKNKDRQSSGIGFGDEMRLRRAGRSAAVQAAIALGAVLLIVGAVSYVGYRRLGRLAAVVAGQRPLGACNTRGSTRRSPDEHANGRTGQGASRTVSVGHGPPDRYRACRRTDRPEPARASRNRAGDAGFVPFPVRSAVGQPAGGRGAAARTSRRADPHYP